MKKIMAVTVVLALTLALVGVVANAEVGSSWTVLTEHPNASADGTVSDRDGAIVLDAPEGAEGTALFNHAGVCFKEAIDIDGLTIVVTPNLFNAAANNVTDGRMGVALTKTAQTDMTLAVSGGTYTPGTAPAETILFGFFNNAAGDAMSIVTGGVDGNKSDYAQTFPAGQDATISFKVIDGKIEISVNGTAVYTSSSADKDVLTDGKAYLSLYAVGFGYAGNTSPFVVKSINGKAANTYPEDIAYEEPAVSSDVSSDATSSAANDTSSATSSTVVSKPASSAAENNGGCGNSAK